MSPRCPRQDGTATRHRGPAQPGSADRPRACGLIYVFKACFRRTRAAWPGLAQGMGAGMTDGTAGRARVPAVGGWGWREVSPLLGGGPARCLSVGERTARAAAAAPFSRTRCRPGRPPSRTPASAPAQTAGPSSPPEAIVSPRKLAV
jgi:hypothetical protein